MDAPTRFFIVKLRSFLHSMTPTRFFNLLLLFIVAPSTILADLKFATFNDSDPRLMSTSAYSSFKVKHDWWLVEHLDVEAFDTLENVDIYLRFAPSLDPSGMHSCYEFKTVAASASSISKKERHKMSAAAFLNTSFSYEAAQQEAEDEEVKTTMTTKRESVEEVSSVAASMTNNALLPETTMPALKSMLSQALAKSGTFCYPAVVVSGVMKCGTSALFELFQKYPGVNAQNGQIYIKENCAFFTSGLANRNLLQYFYSLPTHMNMGDLHVGGCINTKSNELIEKILRRPKTFHIFLFRDFADWIWSAYNFWCSPAFERECDVSNYWAQLFIHSRSTSYFHDYVSKAMEGIRVPIPLPFADPCAKAKTMYRDYWERALQKFPLETVLAISSNELEQQPQVAWARVAERLGLDVHHPHLSSFASQRYNTQIGDKHGSTSVAEFKAGAYEISNFELLKPETRSILDQCWKDDCLWASQLTGYQFPACKSNSSDGQQSFPHTATAASVTSSLINSSLNHQHHATGAAAQHSGFLRKNLRQCHDKFGDPLHHLHRHTHNSVHHSSPSIGGISGSGSGSSSVGGSGSGGGGGGGGRFSRLPKVLFVCSSLEWIEKMHILLTYVTSHTHKHTSRGGEGVSAHFVPQNDSCVTSIDSNTFSASSTSSSFSSTSTSSILAARHEPLVYTIENLYEVQGVHGGVWRSFAAKDDSEEGKSSRSGKGLFFDRHKFSCSNSSSSSSKTHPLVFSKVIYVATDPFEDIWSKYLGKLGYSAGLETKDFLSFDWGAWEEYAQQSLNLGLGDEMQRRKVTLETETLLKTLPQEDLLLFSVATLRSDENRLLILHKLLEFIGLPLGGIGIGGGGGGIGGALQGAALLAEKTTSLSAASASNAVLKFECAYLVANTHRTTGPSVWGNLGGLEARDSISMLGKVYISPSLACSFERAYRGYALFLLPERSESMGGGWWPTPGECERLSSNNFSLSEIRLEERSVGWKNMCKMRYGQRIFQEGNIKALKHPVGLLAYPSIEMLNVRTLLEHSTSIFSGSMTTDYSLLNIFRGENVCGMRVSVVQLNPDEPTIKQQRTGEGVLSLTNYGKKKCMKGLIRGFPRTMLLLRDPFVSIWEDYKKEIGLDATFGVIYKSVYETKKRKREKEKQRLKMDSASSGAEPFSSLLAKKLGGFSNATTTSTIMSKINLHWQKFALKMAANYSVDDLISTKTVLKGLDMFFEAQNVLMISYEKLLFAQGAFFVSTLQNMTDFGGYRRLSMEKLECAHSFLSVFRATEELDAMHQMYSETLAVSSSHEVTPSSSSSSSSSSSTLLLCQVRALLDAKIGSSHIKFPWIRLYHDEMTDTLCAKHALHG